MSDILTAARFAEKHHRGVLRKYNGEPYINHPARVAGKVSYHPASTDEMVQAAWLHDVVEDCGVNLRVLNSVFGADVTKLVDELTNPSKEYPHLKRKERKAIDLAHAGKASKQAKMIKMIDRMDNLRDFPPNDHDARDFVRNLYFFETVNLYHAIKDGDSLLADEFIRCLDETAVRFNIGG